MTKVRIKCPTCNKIGNIEISDDLMKDVSRGLLAVNVAPNVTCSHTFIAYIDKNFNIRDYFTADFQIELPQITPAEAIRNSKIPGKEIVNLDLIKLNMPPMLLTYVIKSIFFKQKMVIIEDIEFLHKHIYNFFKYITQNSFEINIAIITEEMYKNNKKNYKDSMVFEGTNILRNVKKLINPKKLSVEKQIVSRFITEYDLEYSYILLKNEILKAYELSKDIVDFVNNFKERNENVNILKINAKLEEKYEIKLNNLYLKFLMEIVENYHGIALPSFTDSFYDLI